VDNLAINAIFNVNIIAVQSNVRKNAVTYVTLAQKYVPKAVSIINARRNVMKYVIDSHVTNLACSVYNVDASV
jgi:hypothetical protein